MAHTMADPTGFRGVSQQGRSPSLRHRRPLIPPLAFVDTQRPLYCTRHLPSLQAAAIDIMMVRMVLYGVKGMAALTPF